MTQRGELHVGTWVARVYECNTMIVGSGAAGYNAADRLWNLGQHNILLVTENRTAGTSRNTGSDKQTYYKLTLAGDEPDSVRKMAKTLFDGRCVDGDLALCEAALSSRCFFRLTELGVPFPQNRYGEYVGYKTDHDPARRATSAGPYTSRLMTECLERAVRADGVPVLDKTQVIKLLSDGRTVCGALCLDTSAASAQFVLICCRNIIYATGGPAGMYADSAYPPGQYGATGLALEAGAKGKNLTEWQYGIASIKPRWNVSGTYMQVLPRFISTDADGKNEREFLLDFFEDAARMLTMVFLKGYQWPFDVSKAQRGSSLIDLLVYQEMCRGRRVFLDYRSNPANGAFQFEKLDPEAADYLQRAGACFGTPIERLNHMNRPAVDFFRDRGVNLAVQPLEIALCAQHNNGGLAVDCWWQTNLEGLFVVGEAAGTHGVVRPGGTALNAGQVGSMRAALYIAARRRGEAPEGFEHLAKQALAEMGNLAAQCLSDEGNVKKIWCEAARNMSRVGAAVREREAIRIYREQVRKLRRNFSQIVKAAPGELPVLFRLRDMLISQDAYLTAMLDYADRKGKSRGSALYTDDRGVKPASSLPEAFRFCLETEPEPDIQELELRDGEWQFTWRNPRPVPQEDDFFENVWRSYRENENIV